MDIGIYILLFIQLLQYKFKQFKKKKNRQFPKITTKSKYILYYKNLELIFGSCIVLKESMKSISNKYCDALTELIYDSSY
jgi:hypothetical protein